MLQRVYERARSSRRLKRIIIATDDQRIFKAAQAWGAETWMTPVNLNSGTERAAEVAKKTDSPIVINIQGDEPLIKGQMIDDLIQTLQDNTIPMATLAAKTKDLALLGDENIVKVVIDKDGFAMYFSRSPLPYRPSDYFWQHIGIYGYQRNFLLKFCNLPDSRLEKEERLEQLRALENGYRIKVLEASFATLSIDTPQDIIMVENFLKKESHD